MFWIRDLFIQSRFCTLYRRTNCRSTKRNGPFIFVRAKNNTKGCNSCVCLCVHGGEAASWSWSCVVSYKHAYENVVEREITVRCAIMYKERAAYKLRSGMITWFVIDRLVQCFEYCCLCVETSAFSDNRRVFGLFLYTKWYLIFTVCSLLAD